jgi:hypothetical protein
MRLIPRLAETQSWADEVVSFQPSVCHWALYIGFEGDIAQHGATKSNHWFYESWDTNDGIWFDPDGNVTPPMMFVSFASLKDPTHSPGPQKRHAWPGRLYTRHCGGVVGRTDRRSGRRSPRLPTFPEDVSRGGQSRRSDCAAASSAATGPFSGHPLQVSDH